MELDSIPVELDISDALNDIDTLEERINNLLESNRTSDDPRIQRMVAQLEQALEAINLVRQQMADMEFDPNISQTIAEARNQISSLSTELEQAQQNLTEAQEALSNKFALNEKFIEMGEELSNVSGEVENVERKMESLARKIAEASDEATKSDLSKKYQEAQVELDGLNTKLEEVREKFYSSEKEMESAGDVSTLQSNIEGATQEVDNLTEALIDAYNHLDELEQKEDAQIELVDPESTQILSDAVTMIEHRIEGVKEETSSANEEARRGTEEAERAGEAVSRLSSNIINMRGALSGIVTIFRGFNQTISGLGQFVNNVGSKIEGVFKNIASRMREVHKSASQASLSFGQMAVRAVGLMLGVQGAWSILNKLRRTIIENMQYAISGVSALKTSFESLKQQTTTIKVQLASAFLPLVEIALPAIKSVVSALAEAVNMVSQLVAALTGASSWRKANVSVNKGGSSKKSLEQRQAEADKKVAEKNAKAQEAYNKKIEAAYEKAGAKKDQVDARNQKSLQKYEKELEKAKKAVKGYLSPIDEINQYNGNEPIEIEAPELEDFNYDEFLQDLLDDIGEFEPEVAEKLEDTGAGAAGVVVTYTEQAIDSAIQRIADKMKDIAKRIVEPIKKAWKTTGDFVKKSWKKAMDEVLKLGQSVGRDILKVWEQEKTVKIFEDIFKIIGWIGQIIGNLAKKFREAWDENNKGLHILENIRDIIGIIISHIEDMAKKTAEWADQLNFNPIIEAFERWTESLKPVIDNIAGILSDFYTQVLLPLGKWAVEEGGKQLIDVFTRFNNEVDWEHLKTVLSEFWSYLEPFAETVGEGLIKFIDDLAQTLAKGLNSEAFERFFEWLEEHMKNVDSDDVAGVIEKVVKAIGGFLALHAVSSIIGAIASTLGPLVTAAKGIGTMASGISSVVSALGGFTGLGIVALIIAAIAGAMYSFVESYGGFEGAADRLGELINELTDYIKELIDNLDFSDKFDKLKDSVQRLSEQLGDMKLVWEGVLLVLEILAKFLAGWLLPIFGDIVTELSNIIRFISDALQMLESTLEVFVGIITMDGDLIKKGLKGWGDSARDGIASAVASVNGAGKLLIDPFITPVESILQTSWDMSEKLDDRLGENTKKTTEFAESLANAADKLSGVSSESDKASSSASSLLDKLKSTKENTAGLNTELLSAEEKFKRTHTATQDMADGVGKSSSSMQALADKLASTKTNTDSYSASLGAVVDKSNALSGSSDKSASAFSRISEALNSTEESTNKLPTSFGKVQDSMGSMNLVTEDMLKVLASLGSEYTDTSKEIQESSNSMADGVVRNQTQIQDYNAKTAEVVSEKSKVIQNEQSNMDTNLKDKTASIGSSHTQIQEYNAKTASVVAEKSKVIQDEHSKAEALIREKTAKIGESTTQIQQYHTDTATSVEGDIDRIETVYVDLDNAGEELKTNSTAQWQEISQGTTDACDEMDKSTKETSESMVKSFESTQSNLSRIFNAILGMAEKLVNGVIDAFNGLGDRIGSMDFDLPDWLPGDLGGKHFELSLPKLNHVSIPRLAQGAVIPPNQEFMAVLGDQKRGTNIETPLATMVEAFNQALAQNGGGNQSITLNLVLPDKRTIAQYAIEGGQVLQMSRGRNPFLLERG